MSELFNKSLRTLELPRVLQLLAEQAVKAAVADYYQRRGVPCPIDLDAFDHEHEHGEEE